MRKSKFEVVQVRFDLATREVTEKILCTLARKGEANERLRALREQAQPASHALAWKVREVRA